MKILVTGNEKITLSTLDAAIDAHKKGRLKKITLLSSSMVYESTRTYPASESETTKGSSDIKGLLLGIIRSLTVRQENSLI